MNLLPVLSVPIQDTDIFTCGIYENNLNKVSTIQFTVRLAELSNQERGVLRSIEVQSYLQPPK